MSRFRRESRYWRYESRQCAVCERDYLRPFYGGYRRCYDCIDGNRRRA